MVIALSQVWTFYPLKTTPRLACMVVEVRVQDAQNVHDIGKVWIASVQVSEREA